MRCLVCKESNWQQVADGVLACKACGDCVPVPVAKGLPAAKSAEAPRGDAKPPKAAPGRSATKKKGTRRKKAK